jgi:hypothetical protein
VITTAEEYKQALLDIQKGVTVVRTTLPSTEPRIPIDLDTRQISIPDEFKFLATKKETKAETIYFVCDRYFDDIDLSTKTCVVQWVNTDGKITNRGLYPVTEIDTNSVDGKIVFGWTIQSESTQIAGRIEFAITFYEINEDKTIDQSVFEYNLTTLATSSLVLDTLDIWGSTTPPGNPTELQVWLNKINSIAQEANSNNNETKAKIKEFDDNFNGKLTDINNTATSQIDAINSVGTANIRSVNDVGKQNISSVNDAGRQNINNLNDAYTENLRKFNNNANDVYNDKVSSINLVTSAKLTDINNTAQSQIEAINNTAQAQSNAIVVQAENVYENLGLKVTSISGTTSSGFSDKIDVTDYNYIKFGNFNFNDSIIKLTEEEKSGITMSYTKKDNTSGSVNDICSDVYYEIADIKEISLMVYYHQTSGVNYVLDYILSRDYTDVIKKCDSTMNTLNSLAYLTIEEESNGEEIPISYATEAYVTAQINALREELKSNG